MMLSIALQASLPGCVWAATPTGLGRDRGLPGDSRGGAKMGPDGVVHEFDDTLLGEARARMARFCFRGSMSPTGPRRERRHPRIRTQAGYAERRRRRVAGASAGHAAGRLGGGLRARL